mmetsp:Transcript_120711/g.327572  ORF Transcript_120711/g.327572 Transcript_120711/m.327572 type:complete len:92 (-) Transcript_120711:17-292(-)
MTNIVGAAALSNPTAPKKEQAICLERMNFQAQHVHLGAYYSQEHSIWKRLVGNSSTPHSKLANLLWLPRFSRSSLCSVRTVTIAARRSQRR